MEVKDIINDFIIKHQNGQIDKELYKDSKKFYSLRISFLTTIDELASISAYLRMKLTDLINPILKEIQNLVIVNDYDANQLKELITQIFCQIEELIDRVKELPDEAQQARLISIFDMYAKSISTLENQKTSTNSYSAVTKIMALDEEKYLAELCSKANLRYEIKGFIDPEQTLICIIFFHNQPDINLTYKRRVNN